MNKQDLRVIKGNKTFELLKKSLSELMTQTSYDQITIDAICNKCGVTKGAYYHHFKTKDELFRYLMAEKMDNYMTQIILKAKDEYEKEPKKQIECWIAGLQNFVKENRKLLLGRLFISQSSDSWKALFDQWRTLVDELMETWQQDGILRSDISIRELHQYLDSFTYGLSALYTMDYIQVPFNDSLIQSFIDTLFK